MTEVEVPTRRTSSGQLVWVALIAVTVAVGSALVASSGTVGSLERDVFHTINGLPDTLRPAMWVFQLAGLLAVARIYLGAHNPLDVIGGGAIGVALGATLALGFGLAAGERTTTSIRPGTTAEVPQP